MTGMKAYIVSRLGLAIVVVFATCLIVFLIMHLTPGDPIRLLTGGARVSAEKVEELRQKWGLDQPLYIQYFRWLGNILKGDLGTSILQKQAVGRLILGRLPVTLALTTSAMILSILLGLPLGVISAVRQYTFVDHFGMALALFWRSMPDFWLGLMLMLIFGLHLRWLPISGFTGPISLVLPVLTLGMVEVGLLARLMRSEMLEVLREDFVRTARAKGLKEFFVQYKHALRNAIISIVVYLFLGIPWLISGAVVVETVFGLPGMGNLLYRSILGKDFPVVQAIILLIAILTVFFNLLGDILTGILDPRIRYE
jgi:ABC-type dipeptide/oligopeptide/nickel transport system permease component